MIAREIPQFGANADTKNKILDTATEFFALQGYDAVTMKDIRLLAQLIEQVEITKACD